MQSIQKKPIKKSNKNINKIHSQTFDANNNFDANNIDEIILI